MKKIIILLMAVFIAYALNAQNSYKYQIKANGGLSVGVGGVKFDSIKLSSGI